MNLPLAGALPLPARRASLLAVALLGLLVVWIGGPPTARAGVAGQQERWESLESGLAPDQVFDPDQIGVDPQDGSVYILSNNPEFTEAKLDKFSSTGVHEGTVAIDRIPDEPGGESKHFIGIAVAHKPLEATGRVYLIQSEIGLNTTNTHARVATRVLVFSTAPQGGALVEEPSLSLPGANTAEAIFFPNELHVDPTNGDLVLSATALDGSPQLVRITEAGVVRPGRYQEAGTALRQKPGGHPGEINFGFDVGADGTTYIVGDSGAGASTPSVEAFTLPPNFGSSGSPALTALPGFAAAGEAEGWKHEESSFLYLGPNFFDGEGPQVALTTGSDGEETLFWKTGSGLEEQEEIHLHGLSLQQGATNALYGGAAARFECSIESRNASLAAAPDGSLVVLDPGELLFEATSQPTWGFSLAHYGPGGSDCPGPAPSIALKVGATEPSSVTLGSSVTLDAGATEHAGSTIGGLTWIIEKQGGPTETIPVAGPAPALQTPHVFAAAGAYTVRLAITTTESIGAAGFGFVAKPKKLVVTGPDVSGLSPDHGPVAGGTVVTITGTELSGATEVKFGTVAAAAMTPISATEIKATSPAGTAGDKVDVTVTTGVGTSGTVAADQFSYDLPLRSLTIGKAGGGSGNVTCNGASCQSSYTAGSLIHLAAVADSGSAFAGWSGGGCGGAGPCAVVLNADTTVTATFDIVSITPPPAITPPAATPPAKGKTPAEILREKRKKALQKCKKLKGKAKAQCVKKANQIGKPKKKKPGRR